MNRTSLHALGLLVLAGLALGATGCSVDLGQVFTSGDGAGNGGSTGTSTSAGGGGAGGSTVGTGGSSGSTVSTSSSGTTGSTSSTTTSTTTTTTTTTTSATSTDPVGSLPCGNDTCQAPQDYCCWDKWGASGDFESGKCQSSPSDPSQCDTAIQEGGVHTILECTATSQCPQGQFCCGDVVQFNGGGQQLNYYPKVECRDSCEWPSRRMCDQPGDPICPMGTTCKQSQLLPQGVLVCGQ